MAAFLLNAVKSQLPMLIEKFEPELEAGLRSSLRAMKAQHPEESSVFLANWARLDSAVKAELVSRPTAVGGRRVKRNRKTRRSRK